VASLLPLSCIGFAPATHVASLGSWFGRHHFRTRESVALAYEPKDDNTESLAIAESAARLAEVSPTIPAAAE
jgi:hypothetical protein